MFFASIVYLFYITDLQNLFQQQSKFFQQNRSVLQQRLKTVKSLHDQFNKVTLSSHFNLYYSVIVI